jgi:hypothetical protein
MGSGAQHHQTRKRNVCNTINMRSFVITIFTLLIFTSCEENAPEGVGPIPAKKDSVTSYNKQIALAQEARSSGDLKGALTLYKSASLSEAVNGLDLQALASCYSELGQLDSCYVYLQRMVLNGLSSYAEDDFVLFSNSPFAKRFEGEVDSLEHIYFNSIDAALYAELQKVRELDQFARNHLLSEDNQALFFYVDSINEVRLREIVAEYGWPGSIQLGRDRGAILILAHVMFINGAFEHFQPILLEGVKSGNVRSGEYAQIVDKYEWLVNGSQIFGSVRRKDGFIVIRDLTIVDSLRATINLPPLHVFARRVGIELPVQYNFRDVD